MSVYNTFNSRVINLVVLLVLLGATSCKQKQNVIAPTYVEQIPTLIERLKDSNAQVRTNAAKALGEIYLRGDVQTPSSYGNVDSTVIQALTTALKDKDPEVRASAAGIIAQIALPYIKC